MKKKNYPFQYFVTLVFFMTLLFGNRAYALDYVGRMFVGSQIDYSTYIMRDMMSFGDGLSRDYNTNNSLAGGVIWSSSNPDVAQVNSKGIVTATRPGNAVIIVSFKNLKKKFAYYLGVYDYEKHQCEYIAHRGYSSKAPANSLAAIRLAMENGFDYVEFDIWPTYDGEFAIAHDNLMNKSCGTHKYISDLTLKQVTDYNIINGKGLKKYKNECIPSLEQVLELSEAFPESKLCIEIKPKLSKKMIVKLLEMVDEHGMMGRVKFISFQKSNLKTIRQIKSHGGDEAMLVYLTHKPGKAAVKTCKELNADIGLNYKFLSRSIVEDMHENDLKVNVWTVPNKTTANFLINTMKVDCITTDYKLFQ